MLSTWEQVRAHGDANGITLRAAATSLAVKKVAEAHRARGLYP
jgi:glutamate dehydrogenase (NAD(P)+)